MEELRIGELGTVMGTRAAAALIRTRAQRILRECDCLTLDFSGVSSVSNSFADELLGELVAEFGLEECMRRIKIKNANQWIKLVLKHAVAQRHLAPASL